MQVSFQTVRVLAEAGDLSADNALVNWGALSLKKIPVKVFWSEYSNKFSIIVLENIESPKPY